MCLGTLLLFQRKEEGISCSLDAPRLFVEGPVSRDISLTTARPISLSETSGIFFTFPVDAENWLRAVPPCAVEASGLVSFCKSWAASACFSQSYSHRSCISASGRESKCQLSRSSPLWFGKEDMVYRHDARWQVNYFDLVKTSLLASAGPGVVDLLFEYVDIWDLPVKMAAGVFPRSQKHIFKSLK